jgi:hypothetical protein
LERIRKERFKFIDQIYPDIFKAYCYCMSGKYWNPEKYFAVGKCRSITLAASDVTLNSALSSSATAVPRR